jgi:geranylgeranyl transferase type-2 subunit beta
MQPRLAARSHSTDDRFVSYLEDLTWRLASGLSRLEPEMLARHAAFLQAQQRGDGGFAGREGESDLYYTGFAVRGLALCGGLTEPVAQRTAEFLRAKMHAHVPIIDFLSLVYGGMVIEGTTGLDVFAAAAPGWRVAVSEQLERFRRADGGYAKTDEGQSSSTYYSFLMALCNELIGRKIVEPQRLAEFVCSRQRDDGGFVELGPMQKSGTNPTAAAIGLLKLLDRLDDATRQRTTDFLLDMQTDEGGLRANTRIPIADVLSTFTGLLTLADLDALAEVDLVAAAGYVREMESPGGGFRGAAWDDGIDVEYTFYGLAALALLAESPQPK